MHHLCCYTENLNAGTNQDIDAIQDQVLSIRNNDYTPGINMNLIALAGLGANLTRVRLNSPRVQALQPPYFLPLITAAQPPEDAKAVNLTQRPFLVQNSEGIDWQVTGDQGVAQQQYVFNWLTTNMQQARVGEIFTLRGTATTTNVANIWNDIDIQWDFNLPQGQYEVIGGVYYGATAIAFRCLFDGQVFRPGGLGGANEGELPWAAQLNGGLGAWGVFDTVTLPNIQCLSSGADTAQTIYLQVIRVA